MPVIRDYTNPVDAIRPSDVGIEAAVQEGRRVGMFYHQAGEAKVEGARAEAQTTDMLTKQAVGAADQYAQHQTQAEVSHFSATEASILDGLSKNWDQTAANADPNAPNTADKWRNETLEPALQQLSSGMQTQQGKLYAAERIATLRQHFYEKTAVDQSTLAGQAAIQNQVTTQNRLTSVVNNDPSSFDVAAGTADAAMRNLIASNPSITPEQAATLRAHTEDFKAHLAQTSIMSLAQKNPDAARQVLDSGKFGDYLNGEQVEGAGRYIDAQSRLQTEQQKAQELAQRKQLEDDGNAKVSALVASGVQSDGSVHYSPDQIKQLASLVPQYGPVIGERISASINSMVTANDRAVDRYNGKKDVITDPRTYSSLSKNILANPTKATADQLKTQVDAQFNAGKLSVDDWTRLSRQAEDAGVKTDGTGHSEFNKTMDQVFTGLKGSIGAVGPTGDMIKPEAAQRYMQFQLKVHDAVDNERAAGKTDQEIKDDLFEPNSKNYIGNMVPAYAIPQQQQMQDFQSDAQGKPTIIQAPTAAALAASRVAGAPSAPGAPVDTTGLTPEMQAYIKAHSKKQ